MLNNIGILILMEALAEKHMKNQTELAYEYIRERILDGTYRPAQRLVESQLSETIGVSRNTVKKALLKVEQENLVTIEENKGATIKSFTLDEVMNYLEIREVLEGLIAKKAAKSITSEKLDNLEKTLSEMKGFMEKFQYDEYSKLNKVFHGIINSASDNIQAVDMANAIKTQLIRYRFRTVLIPGRSQKSYMEHEQIFLALKNHDEKLAEECIRFHIASVREAIRENFTLLFS
jgi:DNA-binding GntR family transcriptional regulator